MKHGMLITMCSAYYQWLKFLDFHMVSFLWYQSQNFMSVATHPAVTAHSKDSTVLFIYAANDNDIAATYGTSRA
jgi:hypothetical protein